MSKGESVNPQELLSKLRSRLQTDWFRDVIDGLKFKNGQFHLQDRQFRQLENVLTLLGRETQVPYQDLSAKRSNLRPVYDIESGHLGNIPVRTGIVNLHVAQNSEPQSTVLLQYAHMERNVSAPEGEPELYNRGIVNVLTESSGQIHSLMMNHDGRYALIGFVPQDSGQIGIKHPTNEHDALSTFKETVGPGFFHLLHPAALLTLAASDIFSNQERDYAKAQKNIRMIKTPVSNHVITPDGISAELASFLGTTDKRHPLTDLVAPDLIPEQSQVVVTNEYKSFLTDMQIGHYPFPDLFHSHELALHFAPLPWNKPGSTYAVEEMLGGQGYEFTGSATLVPDQRPSGYTHSHQTNQRIVAHGLMMQVWQETLPQSAKNKLLAFCEQEVVQVKNLINHSVPIFTPLPDKGSNSSPYSFDKYSQPIQEKMIAGAIAGLATAADRDMHRYWSGKPLWGPDNETTTRWQFGPEGLEEILQSCGFQTENFPKGTVLPTFVRAIKDGIPELADRPYADPSLK